MMFSPVDTLQLTRQRFIVSSEFPVAGKIFRTGPGARTASCAMSIESFPGVQRPGRGVNYLSSAEVKETVEL